MLFKTSVNHQQRLTLQNHTVSQHNIYANRFFCGTKQESIRKHLAFHVDNYRDLKSVIQTFIQFIKYLIRNKLHFSFLAIYRNN